MYLIQYTVLCTNDSPPTVHNHSTTTHYGSSLVLACSWPRRSLQTPPSMAMPMSTEIPVYHVGWSDGRGGALSSQLSSAHSSAPQLHNQRPYPSFLSLVKKKQPVLQPDRLQPHLPTTTGRTRIRPIIFFPPSLLVCCRHP
jgi:hypothetical protein